MTEKPKSLLPHNEDYILIHKRTLLTDALTINTMCTHIAHLLGANSEKMALFFARTIGNHVSKLTDEQVSKQVDQLIAESWDFDPTPLINTHFPPDDKDCCK